MASSVFTIFTLSLGALLGTLSSLTAQHADAMMPYVYMDYLSQACLYTHHQYIGGFFLCGAFAHGAIFLVRDDFWIHHQPRPLSFSTWLLNHRSSVISHLSYVSLFLGFHTLGLYVHNDAMQASSNPESQIALLPIFAQWIQISHGHHHLF